MAGLKLDRRWKAAGARRRSRSACRWEEIGRRHAERFDRELEEQRAQGKFEERLKAGCFA